MLHIWTKDEANKFSKAHNTYTQSSTAQSWKSTVLRGNQYANSVVPASAYLSTPPRLHFREAPGLLECPERSSGNESPKKSLF